MTLQVGIIGCGAISECHLRAVQAQPDCRVTACCDVDYPAAVRQSKQFDVPYAFSDSESLLNQSQVDAVAICTPPKWHAALAKRALKMGKHVLVEKPLALTLREADQIIAAADDTDRIVGVALMHRYLPAYSATRALIQCGALGTLRQIRLSFGRNMYGDSRFMKPQVDPRGWLVDRAIAGGGILMSSSIHFLSVISYILGEPSATFASGDVRQRHLSAVEGIEDDVEVRVQWDSGVEYIHRESWMTDIPLCVEFDGDADRLVLVGNNLFQLSLHANNSRALSAHYETLVTPPSTDRPAASSNDAEQSLFSSLWADLVGSIRRRAREPRLPSLRHARNIQAIIAAGYQSAATGQACPVDWLSGQRCCIH